MTAQQSVCLSEHVCLCVCVCARYEIRVYESGEEKVTWSRYITQSKNQFFPYVLRYPGLHSLSHNSSSLFKTPAQCVSVTWCNRARSGDTTLGSDGGGGGWVGVLGSSGSEPGSVFDESSRALGGSFSTPPPPFYFPCQLKHICPGLTTHPTPIPIQLEPRAALRAFKQKYYNLF